MDRYITKTKYFSSQFNTAIFSDPIRIYFSNQQESQALELYFKMQSRKKSWELFLKQRGMNNYCYIMLYPNSKEFQNCFEETVTSFAPGEMGEDFVLGIRGPMTPETVDHFFRGIDEQIGFCEERPTAALG